LYLQKLTHITSTDTKANHDYNLVSLFLQRTRVMLGEESKINRSRYNHVKPTSLTSFDCSCFDWSMVLPLQWDTVRTSQSSLVEYSYLQELKMMMMTILTLITEQKNVYASCRFSKAQMNCTATQNELANIMYRHSIQKILWCDVMTAAKMAHKLYRPLSSETIHWIRYKTRLNFNSLSNA